MAIAVLDASVVIALFDATDAHHERAAAALTRVRDHRRVVPATAYAECLVGPLRRGGSGAETIERALSDGSLELAVIDRDVARHAAQLRARHTGLALPDALVLGTAEALDAAVVLTADGRWARYGRRVRVI